MNTVFNDSLLAIPYNEPVTFRRYIRLVLPVDGFIFWIRQSLINLQSPALNGMALNELPDLTALDDSLTVTGSLWYAANNQQENTQIHTVNNVFFTSSKKLDDFQDLGESQIWIGEIDGVRFSFNRAGNFFQKAGVWSYQGDSINPIMASQIIDNLADLKDEKIVNDSLPLFLSNNFGYRVYPAFRGSQNLKPPFISIDVMETKPLQQRQSEESTERRQWCLDTVKATCYGLSNNAVLDYMNSMIELGLTAVDFGISNSLTAKKIDIPQSELNITANAKEVTFEVNYYQTRAHNIAQKLIESALCSVSINPILN